MAAMARVSFAAGLRLVAKVSLVYILLAFIIVIYVYKAQKYKDFLKRQKILDIFLRNVEIMFSGDIFLCKVTKSFVN